MLGALGLFSTRPWETTSLVPSVAISPDLGAALGEAVEVDPAGGPGVALARVAGGGPSVHLAEPVAVSGPERDGSSGPLLAVSKGYAVAQAGSSPVPPAASEPPPSPPPVTQPVAAAPAPAPTPVVPAASPAPPLVAGTGSGTPGTSGAIIPPAEGEPPQSCEGAEYVFTVTPQSEETVSEESQLDILIQRFAGDGSESELSLEGDLGDVRSLVSLFVSEGNCVRVEFGPIVTEGPVSEVAETAAPGEMAEPALP